MLSQIHTLTCRTHAHFPSSWSLLQLRLAKIPRLLSRLLAVVGSRVGHPSATTLAVGVIQFFANCAEARPYLMEVETELLMVASTTFTPAGDALSSLLGYYTGKTSRTRKKP